MQLICFSVSHHNTPVELRECLALPPEMLEEALNRVPLHAGRYKPLSELVALSTCNRLEIYALVAFPKTEDEDEEEADASQLLLDYLREAFAIPVDLMAASMHIFSGIEVVEHLFMVTAGLDSVAIGETQILGQVSHALDTCLSLGYTRHALASLFRSAIHAGKRVRTETEIGRHPTSISSVAIQLAEQVTGSLATKSVLVIGTGKMGKLAIDELRERGARQIVLANRTFRHASELAERVGASALPLDRIAEGLAEADLVITSTSSPRPIIHKELITEVMAQRPQTPLTLVDLSVPRNIETNVREIHSVQVFDMDDLQSFVNTADLSSHHELSYARQIVAEEVAGVENLLMTMPFIGELHRKVELIRQRELERTLRNLPGADPQVSEQLEIFSRALVRKILHEPTMHLRTETDPAALREYVDSLTRLFDLDEHPAQFSLQASEAARVK